MIVGVQEIALDANTGRRRLLGRRAGYRRIAYDWGLARFERGLDNGSFRDWRDINQDGHAGKSRSLPMSGRALAERCEACAPRPERGYRCVA